jgi:hypothetical protein
MENDGGMDLGPPLPRAPASWPAVEVSKRLGRLQWSCEDVEEGCGGVADQRWGELGRFDLAQVRAEWPACAGETNEENRRREMKR